MSRRLEKNKTSGKTVTLKVKFADFQQITRSKTLQYNVKEFNDLFQIGEALMKAVDMEGRKVRLLGLTVSNLDGAHSEESSNLDSQQLTIDFS